MTTADSCARHIGFCRRSGGSLTTSAADGKTWYLALSELIERGALDDASYAAPLLAAAFPSSVYLARAAMLLNKMPAASSDQRFASFIPSRGIEVQLCAFAGAETLLLVFGGRHGGLGMPLSVAHRWFGTLGVHIAYLKDPRALGFVGGIPSLGPDRAATIAGIRKLAERIGASQVTCCGNSIGGYAAMLYGHELGARTVVAMNALDFSVRDNNLQRIGDRLAEALLGPDLPALYAGGGAAPLLFMVYDPDRGEDAALPRRMAEVTRATLIPVRGTDGHDAHVTLMSRGALAALFDKLR